MLLDQTNRLSAYRTCTAPTSKGSRWLDFLRKASLRFPPIVFPLEVYILIFWPHWHVLEGNSCILWTRLHSKSLADKQYSGPVIPVQKRPLCPKFHPKCVILSPLYEFLRNQRSGVYCPSIPESHAMKFHNFTIWGVIASPFKGFYLRSTLFLMVFEQWTIFPRISIVWGSEI